MTLKCCYYEKDGEKKHICTKGSSCPTLIGWKLIGSWEVDNCQQCWDDTRIKPGFYVRPIIDIALIVLIAKWISENWSFIFPDFPKTDLLKDIIKNALDKNDSLHKNNKK